MFSTFSVCQALSVCFFCLLNALLMSSLCLIFNAEQLLCSRTTRPNLQPKSWRSSLRDKTKESCIRWPIIMESENTESTEQLLQLLQDVISCKCYNRITNKAQHVLKLISCGISLKPACVPKINKIKSATSVALDLFPPEQIILTLYNKLSEN